MTITDLGAARPGRKGQEPDESLPQLSDEVPRRRELLSAGNLRHPGRAAPPRVGGRSAPATRYALEQQLGGGRSGEVFRARDSQTGATVVYKRVARAVLTSPGVVERSQRELKQLQRAQSPRIARVLDFGKEPDGNLFVDQRAVRGTAAGSARGVGRSRSSWIAPRRSSPRSARRCWKGRRSASCTTTWPPRTCWSARPTT